MTIKLGHKAGLGKMDLDEIEVFGEVLDKVRMHWKRPDSAIAERFPQLKIRNKGACSGCNMNLLNALNEIKRDGQEVRRETIAMGQDTPLEYECLLIGNCTSPFWRDYEHLPGCPPRIVAIKEILAKRTGVSVTAFHSQSWKAGESTEPSASMIISVGMDVSPYSGSIRADVL